VKNARAGGDEVRKADAGVRFLVLAAAVFCAASSSARPLQQVLNTGTLRVGTALAAPWTLQGRDALVGFEIEVANKLAEDMGVRPQIVVYEFDELVPALESGEIDIIAAGFAITPERALHVNFSEPYASGGITLATNTSSTSEIERFEQLNDGRYTIAAVEGSVGADLAQRLLPAAEVAVFPSIAAASAALVAGDADAYLEEEPVPTFLALEHPNAVDVPVARPLLQSHSAFAVAKGDPDFLAFLDAWITARDADTWLPTTRRYWFESLAWRER
jgi:polar amino acid transport system substrate-binding protein